MRSSLTADRVKRITADGFAAPRQMT